MLRILTGAILLLSVVNGAWAQPAGEVESIGFNNVYRAGCWTHMVVRIKPNNAPTGTYQIQIKQRDLDNDVAIFTRNIALTGGGATEQQRFEMLFIPQPVNGGIPGSRDGGTLRDVQSLLEVYLCDESGKQITQLPVTAIPENVDPPGGFEGRRGCRLIVMVNDGGAAATWQEYAEGLQDRKALLGVLEDVLFVNVRSRDLPENPLAYESVDAVVWLSGDPSGLRSDGGRREQALRSYIRGGGHLVISQQTTNWQQTLEFGDLLPVEIEGVGERTVPEPLRTLARGTRSAAAPRISERWNQLQGPFRIALATPRSGSVVDLPVVPPPTPDDPRPPDFEQMNGRPFLVRRLYGCGAVTWVAQDLGDPVITRVARLGWVNIWNAVLGYRDNPIPGGENSGVVSTREREDYGAANAVDIGVAINVGLESKARVGLFITLAVVFFILYWLLAGPGVFMLLATRKQAHLSWFGYAVVALGATLLTVLVVRLLVRGPPELRHLTLLRGGDAEQTSVRSRFGLYIPRDGVQAIALAQPAAAGAVATIAALPIHPVHLRGEIDTAGKLSYNVPVREPGLPGAATLQVPYRSTLKLYEARWAGEMPGRIEGLVRVDRNVVRNIDGRLTNGTGRDLQNVYLIYKVKFGGGDEDWMIYLPAWKSGETIDLQQRMRDAEGRLIPSVNPETRDIPGIGKPLVGVVALDWLPFWLIDFRSRTQIGEAGWDDLGVGTPRALPMLTLFNRLPTARSDVGRPRVELLRRGARQLDLSPAIAAGGLVIVAEAADVPQPLGLTVEGEATPGTGRMIYQYVLPVTRVETIEQ